MATKKGGAGPGENNNNELMLAGAICLFVVIGWYFLHAKVATLVLAIRMCEVWAISFFTDTLLPYQEWMRTINRASVKLSDLFVVSQKVGAYTRFVTAPALAYLGFKLFKNSPTERFKQTYTDKTLPLAVADIYPWMKISTRIDFAKMDPEVGPWAYAETERMFARKHKIKNERGEYDPIRAEQVFAKQLGNMWINYKNLKPHAKAIFAMLAARLNKDFKTSDMLLCQLANSAATGALNYDGVDELAQKYMDSKPVQRIFRQHAYESTVLMQMLDVARGTKDYLPPNWFLWLKGVDRRLWYSLADVGRDAVHVECAGVFSHWRAERARKKALQMPFVIKAVEGLEIELKKLTEDGDDDGLTDDLPPLEIHEAPVEKIPTPEEAEMMRLQKQHGAGGAKRINDNE